MRQTLVISAFPACGKSTFFRSNNNYTCIDSDSSLFSWIYENGKRTEKRNPDFPNNYIEHIRKYIGVVDIIFVSCHKDVRDALTNANIRFHIVYPDKSLKEAWTSRFIRRGNEDAFLVTLDMHFDNWVEELHKYFNACVRGKWIFSNEYDIIDDELIDTILKA